VRQAIAVVRTGTPIVDRVLWDPLSIPPGVDAWLRHIEAGARRRAARLQTLEGPDALPVLTESLEELTRFLEDERSSALLRVLRRPLRQLELGTAASRSFTRLAQSLFERADLAAKLQREAAAVRERIGIIVREFGERLPRSTVRHLRDAELTESALQRARQLSDLRALERRAGAGRWSAEGAPRTPGQ
jgi:hypothetical protein